jgi:2-polyprenyl-3-methyl-5-hydroxy-6-metoxy-1,4-benzoquinol methylase
LNNKTGLIKRKLHLAQQWVLLKLLSRTHLFDQRIRYSDLSPALYRILQMHPDDRVAAFRDCVEEQQVFPASPVEEIDKIVNFSAYLRDSWMASKAAAVKEGALVLDAGAGQCQYKPLFSHANYKAQDFAQYQGNDHGLLKETWKYPVLDYICDITQIPVADCTFDVVVCTEVLEHVPDPIAALKEICRLTQEGGTLLISAPLGSGMHQEPYHYYGGFSKYFYEKYLAEFGCEIIEIKPVGGLLRHVAQEIHRVARTIELSGDTMSIAQRYLMTDWLPRFLSNRDDAYFVQEFTVGYLVEARKLSRNQSF